MPSVFKRELLNLVCTQTCINTRFENVTSQNDIEIKSEFKTHKLDQGDGEAKCSACYF